MSQITPGIYRHFKGGMYRVLGMARHSETLEELVVYQSLADGAFWVRPANMWVEFLERDGVRLQLFQKIIAAKLFWEASGVGCRAAGI